MTPLIRRVLSGAFYLASVLVGLLSLAPSAAVPEIPVDDKTEHVLAYAVLGLLGGVASRRGIPRLVLGLGAYGAVLELLQAFSPGRAPEAADAVADIIGACLGAGMAVVLRRAALTGAK
ncbi:MAG TPA: VanZ family protein [Dongiaceae bacterium]|nr:VanZ family protein [Dongiaceae bacterium]